MTKEEFEELTDEEAFNLCCSGVIAGECDGKEQGSHTFDITRMAY